MNTNDYNDGCPNCGGCVYLTAAQIDCRVMVQWSGWDFSDADWMNTENEKFTCANKCLGEPTMVPAKWVSKDMSRDDAIKEMRERYSQERLLTL